MSKFIKKVGNGPQKVFQPVLGFLQHSKAGQIHKPANGCKRGAFIFMCPRTQVSFGHGTALGVAQKKIAYSLTFCYFVYVLLLFFVVIVEKPVELKDKV